MKGLVVLGSTGSIGRQTLDIVRSLPDRFKVLGLAAGNNLELLASQVDEFRPEMVFHLKGAPIITSFSLSFANSTTPFAAATGSSE